MCPETLDSDAPPADAGQPGNPAPVATDAAGATSGTVAEATTGTSEGQATAAAGGPADAVTGPGAGNEPQTPPPAEPEPARADATQLGATPEAEREAVAILLGLEKPADTADQILEIQAQIDALQRKLAGLRDSVECVVEREESAKALLRSRLTSATPVLLFKTPATDRVLAVYFDYLNERQVAVLPILDR